MTHLSLSQMSICLIVILALSVSVFGHVEEGDDVTLDVAIKLKREYSDDVVSDLFATSHNLIKISRAIELDKDGLFHFRIQNPEFYEEDMRPSQTAGHRTKRHVLSKIDQLKADNRVAYVREQRYLTRNKRKYLPEISERQIEELYDEDNSVFDFVLNDLAKGREYDSYDNERGKEDEIEFENLLNDLKSKVLEKSKDMQRSERDSIKLKDLPKEINFNDKDFSKQWYLINQGQLHIPKLHDLNVKNAWVNGYTGKNVSIVVIDDGLDHEHPDFEGKYRPDLSYDLNDENDKDHDPMPSSFDDNNNHGTKCAGSAAAKANNSICGVGVAYDADIGGIRLLDGRITDLLEARSLLYKAADTDIKTMSWGPNDDGTRMEHPQTFVSQALEEGVKIGRKGKGLLYIWASGNGGRVQDDCGADGYVSNWNVISIGSINHHGVVPTFSEYCPSTMAVVYSGGRSDYGGSEDDPGVRVSTTNVRGQCDNEFQGTSASAPVAAGGLALVLEANPNLGYRDVMHLIARTSRIPNIEDKEGWIINGANYHVNDKYGFGVLDISQMINEAVNWTNVPARQICHAYRKDEPVEITSGTPVNVELNVNCDNINILEHVVANISFSYPVRGEVKLILISPSGTPSELVSFRQNDKTKTGIHHFPFMTVFNWGESPNGIWKLIIKTKDGEPMTGSLDSFSLNLYGFEQENVNTEKSKRHLAHAYIPSNKHIEKIYQVERRMSKDTVLINKRTLKRNA